MKKRTKSCIQSIVVKRVFKPGEVFYHSMFGERVSQFTVVSQERDHIVIERAAHVAHSCPIVKDRFFPCDAGCIGWKYDSRPCTIGKTEAEALAGGKAYHRWWEVNYSGNFERA